MWMAGLFQITERDPQWDYLSFLSPQPVSRCTISLPQSNPRPPPPPSSVNRDGYRVTQEWPGDQGVASTQGGSSSCLEFPDNLGDLLRVVTVGVSWRIRNVSTPHPHTSVYPFHHPGVHWPVTSCFLLLGTRSHPTGLRHLDYWTSLPLSGFQSASD